MTGSTKVPDTLQIPDGGIEQIQAILSSGSMPLRNPRRRVRDMMDAVQPLSIDGNEISIDTIVAELVTYSTVDQMNRETATWTLKKSVFGDFESSMTPIPKYCFKNSDTNTAVVVSSVPRFSLHDILSRSEKEFHSPYTYNKIHFYSDWFKLIIGRIRRATPSGNRRLLRTIMTLPKCLLPMPPHISQQERIALAARLCRIVVRHHRAGIFHDRISERTIFFPTSYQPLMLSNYSGVPATMLADIIPAELLTNSAVEKYGPQCRDVYCMALIGYRILTGEQIDGRRFTLESPRPLQSVLDDIACNVHLTFKHKNLSEIAHTAVALYRAVRAIFRLLPSLFSRTTFPAWRKINRATGGLWRALPIVGPFADIFAPTPGAAALRCILDKHWRMNFRFVKSKHRHETLSHSPEITLLTAAFIDFPTRKYPHFESALNALISDSGHKRMAFGSLMEAGNANDTASKSVKGIRQIIADSVICIIVTTMVLFSTINDRSKTAAGMETTGSLSTPPVTVTPSAPTKPRPVVNPPDTPAIATSVSDSTGNAAAGFIHDTLHRPTPSDSLMHEKNRALRSAATAATTHNSDIPAATVTRKTKNVSVAKNTPQKTTSASSTTKELATNGYLVPATGFQGVYIVTDVIDSCNPGRLHFRPEGGRSTMMVSQFPSAPLTLFMVHRSAKGFGSTTVIQLCRTGGCDQTMYYRTTAKNGIGSPVYVRSGDAISPDKNGLQRFVTARLSLYGR